MNTEEPILTKDLRNTLKDILQNEISKLPESLEKLDPKERLNFLCKIMPYVFPKVEAINSKEGEPFTFD
ncbi:hypothetical protein AAGF08_08795 [Algoriphagus sp. SE2]|uniref:hypothetical protein n=1 Tax=Algoriphagus sp. SE2 TaxID=3141536 RepID=UPI0031CDA5AE